MQEREQFLSAKQNLANDYEQLRKSLKNYIKANIDYRKSFITNAKNNVINKFKEKKRALEIEKSVRLYEKEQERINREQQERIHEAERLREIQREEELAQRKRDFKAAIKQDKRFKRAERLLNLRNNAIHKVDIAKSWIGNVGNGVKENFMLYGYNADLVVREKIDQARLYGLTKTYQMAGMIEQLKENYRNYQRKREIEKSVRLYEKEQEKINREQQERIREAEELRELQREEELAQRKRDFKAAIKQDKKDKRAARLLKMRETAKAKVDSVKSKVGDVKDKTILYGLEKRREYALKELEKEEQKKERERQERIRDAEELREIQREEELAQRKRDFKAAIRQDKRDKRAARLLEISEAAKAKVDSVKSKIGVVKDKTIEFVTVYGNNVDLAVRRKVDQARLYGLEKRYQVANTIQEMKDNYQERKEEKRREHALKELEKEEQKKERERQERIREAEELREIQREEELAQRKKDMDYALKKFDREQLEQEHNLALQQMQELRDAISETRGKHR